MPRRLQLERRKGADPMLVLMDCSLSCMFAMALFIRPQAAETFEVPVSRSPISAAASAPSTEARPVVRVDALGAVTLNGHPTEMDAVAEAVQQFVSSQEDTDSNVKVRMEAHRQAEYGRIFAVREQLQAAGFDVIEVGQVQP